MLMGVFEVWGDGGGKIVLLWDRQVHFVAADQCTQYCHLWTFICV